MLDTYSLRLPGRVHAGLDALSSLSGIVEREGAHSVLLLSDKGVAATGLVDLVTKHIGVPCRIIDDIPSEPACDAVQAIAAQAAGEDELIVAVGGGSVMDTAKLVGVLGPELTVRDLLKDPSCARKRRRTVMIPTTCGTGSEATCNAIVLVPEEELKVGIVSDAMIADYVILDPVMVASLPRRIAASTGLDALCHAIECYTGAKANPFSDLFALEAMRLIFPSIVEACREGGSAEAKGAMLIAAFYGGVAITSSGTTAVHALSYPLGGRYHIAHGVSNAMLLAPVMRFNAPSCTARLARVWDDCICTGGHDLSDEEKAGRVIARLEEIVGELDIPRLSSFGITQEDIPPLAKAGLEVTRLMVNNPRKMDQSEAEAIFREAL